MSQHAYPLTHSTPLTNRPEQRIALVSLPTGVPFIFRPLLRGGPGLRGALSGLLFVAQELFSFLSFFWVVSACLFSPWHNCASKNGAGACFVVLRKCLFYAQEVFLHSHETFCRVSGFASFVTQRGAVIPVAASSLVAELDT